MCDCTSMFVSQWPHTTPTMLTEVTVGAWPTYSVISYLGKQTEKRIRLIIGIQRYCRFHKSVSMSSRMYDGFKRWFFWVNQVVFIADGNGNYSYLWPVCGSISFSLDQEMRKEKKTIYRHCRTIASITTALFLQISQRSKLSLYLVNTDCTFSKSLCAILQNIAINITPWTSRGIILQ